MSDITTSEKVPSVEPGCCFPGKEHRDTNVVLSGMRVVACACVPEGVLRLEPQKPLADQLEAPNSSGDIHTDQSTTQADV